MPLTTGWTESELPVLFNNTLTIAYIIDFTMLSAKLSRARPVAAYQNHPPPPPFLPPQVCTLPFRRLFPGRSHEDAPHKAGSTFFSAGAINRFRHALPKYSPLPSHSPLGIKSNASGGGILCCEVSSHTRSLISHLKHDHKERLSAQLNQQLCALVLKQLPGILQQ